MEPQSAEEPSKELERLADEQLSDLDSEARGRPRRGRRRRDRVAALYAAGAVSSPADHYHAALVMLYGEELEQFELARTLATIAAHAGQGRAWWIIAAATDRALIARGQPQRFGTQYIREQGRWTLGRVDPRTTDSERAFFGILPLWVQRQHLDQIQQRESSDE